MQRLHDHMDDHLRLSVLLSVGGGSPPYSSDRGAPDSDGYSTANETAGHQHQCRGHRGSREKKQLAPARLDMPVGEVHPLTHQTGEHQTLMVIPLQMSLQAISTNAGAIEGVGRRSSWLLQDWICQSSSQLIQVRT